MTTPDLRTAAAKAAQTLRATADGFERREDAGHPLSQLLVNSLRRDADDIDAALAAARPELQRVAEEIEALPLYSAAADTMGDAAEIMRQRAADVVYAAIRTDGTG